MAAGALITFHPVRADDGPAHAPQTRTMPGFELRGSKLLELIPTPQTTPGPQQPTPRLRGGLRNNHATRAKDAAATLEAIDTALRSVRDGGSFVFHRNRGALTGIIKPTRTFRAHDGRLCRDIEVELNAQHRARRVVGTACLDAQDTWRLGASHHRTQSANTNGRLRRAQHFPSARGL